MDTNLNLELVLDQYKNNSYLTHNFHPYPAKFIPQIPKMIMLEHTKEGDLILDPFSGSGTTLVEAKLNGRPSIGIDLNPIAVLMAKVKTTVLNKQQIAAIQEITNTITKEITSNKEYALPTFININLWFEEFIQKELSVIKHHVESLREGPIKNFLKLAFSSIIVKASNQDSDTRYVSVKKNRTRHQTSHFFESKVKDMLKRISDFGKVSSDCSAEVYMADSTKIDFIGKKVSLAITSPPYMNSFDYYLYHKHRMHWLGYDVKSVQEREVGSRNKHNDNNEGIETYNLSITKNAKEVKKILKKGGLYCIVVGDSVLKGKLIQMNKIYDDIFIREAGYSKVSEVTFDQRKYTKTFTPNLQSLPKKTYLLVYSNN